MKTCKEIAKEWKISERSVANLCKQGRIAGATKVGKVGRSRMMRFDLRT